MSIELLANAWYPPRSKAVACMPKLGDQSEVRDVDSSNPVRCLNNSPDALELPEPELGSGQDPFGFDGHDLGYVGWKYLMIAPRKGAPFCEWRADPPYRLFTP